MIICYSEELLDVKICNDSGVNSESARQSRAEEFVDLMLIQLTVVVHVNGEGLGQRSNGVDRLILHLSSAVVCANSG